MNTLTRPGQLSESPSLRTLTEASRHFIETATIVPVVPKDEPMIHVSSVLSGAATFYERLRYSIDYRESHLLRRHAIERILRRRFLVTGDREELGKLFVVELVQAGYLKNDSVPESVVPKVERILSRYQAALLTIEGAPLKDKEVLRDWFLGLASAELESFFVPSPRDEGLVDLVTSVVKRDAPLKDWQVPPDLEEVLVFVAAYRALFAFDPATLHYLLLLKRTPEWMKAGPEDVPHLFPRLLEVHRASVSAMQHPAGERLWRVLKSRAIVFHALSDVVAKFGSDAPVVLSHPEKTQAEIEKVCKGYYTAARRRLYGSAVKATFYVFLTKVVIAIGIEAPIERFIYGTVHQIPLLINLIFPPTLLVLVAVFTRFPGVNNTALVLDHLQIILSGGEKRIVPEVRRVRRSAGADSGLSLLYGFVFLLTFGLIAWGLSTISYTVISIALFLFFLCVVSFFALRIRQPVRDLFVKRPRENILSLLLDFFSLPILRVGRWISMTSARFNVFLFFFDYFLEAPIKAVLLVSEDVVGFFREKREDIV